MTKQVRTLTATDKALLALALRNAGIKARIRKFPTSIRVVFEGSWEAVRSVLNAEGFRFADGNEFGRFSNNGNEAHIRFMEA